MQLSASFLFETYKLSVVSLFHTALHFISYNSTSADKLHWYSCPLILRFLLVKIARRRVLHTQLCGAVI